MIVVDPINSYLSGVDSHNNAEMRGALTPLKRVAEKYGVAVLIVAHLNKNTEGSAMNRVSGSLALVAASRAAFMVGTDPKDSSRRVLVPAKQNLTEPTSALAFKTVGAEVETTYGVTNVGRIEWLGKVEGVTPEDVLKPATIEKRSALDSAMEWLQAYMKPGQRYDAEELKACAKADLISEASLRRAKERLLIGAMQRRSEDGVSIAGWDWVLPDGVVEEGDSWHDGRNASGKVSISFADAERNAKAYFKKVNAKRAAASNHESASRRRPHLN